MICETNNQLIVNMIKLNILFIYFVLKDVINLLGHMGIDHFFFPCILALLGLGRSLICEQHERMDIGEIIGGNAEQLRSNDFLDRLSGPTILIRQFCVWWYIHSMFRRSVLPSVTFATSVWDKDWRHVLLDPDYLRVRQIGNHSFPFSERLLVINNVSDPSAVRAAAEAKVADGTLTGYCLSDEIAPTALSFFQLERADFRVGPDAPNYIGVNPDWIYYNALGPLSALYAARSEYLLYLTGDVKLDKKVDWIGQSIRRMEKSAFLKVANLVWNGRVHEARKESYKREWNFYLAKEGFSDQMFLVKTSDFRQPIYGEIRPDSSHFPRGDVWEKRAFSAMKNRGWERLIYARGSYTHENF